MKRSLKSALGVTLLEIMLVLAIAAMVIVMSIRYYQTASLNQKVASAMNGIMGVLAASESYLGATSTLPKGSSSIVAYLPGGKMPTSPWSGADMKVGDASGSGTYTITVPDVPTNACTPLMNLVKQNAKMNVTAPACDASTGLVATVTP